MAHSHLQPPQPLPRNFYESFLCTGRARSKVVSGGCPGGCCIGSAVQKVRGGCSVEVYGVVPGDTGTAPLGIPKVGLTLPLEAALIFWDGPQTDQNPLVPALRHQLR